MRTSSALRGAALSAVGLSLLFAFNNCGPQAEPVNNNAFSTSSTGCPIAPSNLRSPTTIDQTVQLINALPKPLSLPCFVENLATPLKVFALQSSFSAQPSESINTPRIMIIRDKLALSIVPTGIGKNLLEFGEQVDANFSVKAELVFPVTATLPASAPYTRIKETTSNATNCRGCHSGERNAAGYGGPAFASAIVRPDSIQRVTSVQGYNAALNCNSSSDAYRCNMMRAVFITGSAEDVAFP